MRAAGLVNRGLLMLMAGHFTVDLYGGLLPVLYPILRERLALDLGAIGLIATLFTTALSVSQPLFGLFVDRFGSRWLGPLAVLWMGVFFTLIGFAPSYPAILGLAVLAALGSGAYHPLGASNVPLVTSSTRLNTSFSLFTVGGTSGFALGPLVGAALFGVFGLRGPLLVLPLAIGVAIWLAFGLRSVDLRRATPQRAAADTPRRTLQLRPLLAVLGIVMLRSWTFMVLINFLPLLYQSLGYGAGFYSPLLFVIIISGSAGTIVGGLIADRFSRKVAIVGSLLLLGPAIWLLLAFPGPGAFALGALAGFIADFSLPATLTLAQGLMPGRVGVTTGLILGIGFVTAGIGVSITGAVGDRIGLAPALTMLPLLLIGALALTFFLPGDRRAGRDLRPQQDADADDPLVPSLGPAGRA
jgi:FSR family fosmidomycin resistance protein-like MFS transporter